MGNFDTLKLINNSEMNQIQIYFNFIQVFILIHNNRYVIENMPCQENVSSY